MEPETHPTASASSDQSPCSTLTLHCCPRRRTEAGGDVGGVASGGTPGLSGCLGGDKECRQCSVILSSQFSMEYTHVMCCAMGLLMAQHCTKLQTAYNLGSFTNVNAPHNCYMNPSLLPTVPAPPSSQPFWAPTFSQPFWPLPPPNCSSPSLLPTVQAPPSSQPFRPLPPPNRSGPSLLPTVQVPPFSQLLRPLTNPTHSGPSLLPGLHDYNLHMTRLSTWSTKDSYGGLPWQPFQVCLPSQYSQELMGSWNRTSHTVICPQLVPVATQFCSGSMAIAVSKPASVQDRQLCMLP